jgi:hypothetical protein
MEIVMKKEVCLWGLDQLALIVKCKSGVFYQNQTAGTSCTQSEQEGILVIISEDAFEASEEIEPFMKKVNCLTKKEDMDKLDDILSKYIGTCMFSVDRDEKSYEAWVHVNIKYVNEHDKLKKNKQEVSPSYDFKGFIETKGVLTWANSD